MAQVHSTKHARLLQEIENAITELRRMGVYYDLPEEVNEKGCRTKNQLAGHIKGNTKDMRKKVKAQHDRVLEAVADHLSQLVATHHATHRPAASRKPPNDDNGDDLAGSNDDIIHSEPEAVIYKRKHKPFARRAVAPDNTASSIRHSDDDDGGADGSGSGSDVKPPADSSAKADRERRQRKKALRRQKRATRLLATAARSELFAEPLPSAREWKQVLFDLLSANSVRIFGPAANDVFRTASTATARTEAATAASTDTDSDGDDSSSERWAMAFVRSNNRRRHRTTERTADRSDGADRPIWLIVEYATPLAVAWSPLTAAKIELI